MQRTETGKLHSVIYDVTVKDLRFSKTPNVFSTVDFGPESNPKNCFAIQNYFEPKGPFVNSEYYPGWLDHWGKPHRGASINHVDR